MAINDGTTEVEQKQPKQHRAAEALRDANAGQSNQGTVRPQGSFSLRAPGSMMRSAMGRTPASEVLNKLNKAMQAVIDESADKTFSINLLPIDMNSNPVLGISVLVITAGDLQNKDLGIAYHTLIVEASIETPPPKFEMINGQNVEILRTVDGAYDNVMRDFVKDYVAKIYPNTKLTMASACVVPRSFNIADAGLIYGLVSNALFAVTSELQMASPTFTDLNLVNIERDSNLTVRTTFGNQQAMNVVGQPLRSDIIIDFQAVPNQTNTQQQLSSDRTNNISRVSGFMDMEWDPAQATQNPYSAAYTVANYQKYAARFVNFKTDRNHFLNKVFKMICTSQCQIARSSL